MKQILDQFIEISLKKAYEGQAKDEGGIECYEDFKNQDRIYLYIFNVLISTLIIYLYLINNFQNVSKNNEFFLKLKKLAAIFGLLQYPILIMLKVNQYQLIHILNPCHIACFIQSLVILQKNSKTQQRILISQISWSLGGYLVLYSPQLLEKTFLNYVTFYTEHALIAFIFPILNTLDGTFDYNSISFKSHVFSFATFIIYQSIILFPISSFTYVNLNYCLCPQRDDFLAKNLGIYYIILAPLYLFFVVYVLNRILYKFAFIIKEKLMKAKTN